MNKVYYVKVTIQKLNKGKGVGFVYLEMPSPTKDISEFRQIQYKKDYIGRTIFGKGYDDSKSTNKFMIQRIELIKEL